MGNLIFEFQDQPELHEMPPIPLGNATLDDLTQDTDVDVSSSVMIAAFESDDIPNDHQAIAVGMQSFDRMCQALEQMYVVKDIITKASDRGMAFEEATVKMMDTVLSRTATYVGFTYSPLVPSIEGHSVMTRRHMTQIAVESIMDRIKAFAKKLADMIRNLWKKIKAFIGKLFDRRDAQESQLKEDLKEVESLPDTPPAKRKIEPMRKRKHPVRSIPIKKVAQEDDSSYMQVFMDQVPFGINGKCDYGTTETIINNTSTLIRANREIILEIVDCMKQLTQDKIDYPKLIDEVEDLVSDIKRSIGQLPLNYKKTVDNTVLYSYGQLVGSQTCVLHEKMGKSDDNRVFNIRVEIKRDNSPAAYIPDTLAKREMSKLIVSSMKLIEQTRDLEKVSSIVENVLNRSVSFLETKLHEYDDRERGSVNLALGLIRDLFAYISQNLPKLIRDCSRVASSVHYYVKSSVGSYM